MIGIQSHHMGIVIAPAINYFFYKMYLFPFAITLIFAIFHSFTCTRLQSRRTLPVSTGKRHSSTTVDSVGDDEISLAAVDDDDDILLADSLEIIFLFDQMFPDSHYEDLSDKLTSRFDRLNQEGFCADFVYQKSTPAHLKESDEKPKSTDKFINSSLHINESIKPYQKPSQNSHKYLHPLQVIPQMTSVNLQVTFTKNDQSNFLVLLSSVGPYWSDSILEYLQNPSTRDLTEFFNGSLVEEAVGFVPLHYLKKQEYELFRAFLSKYKFKSTNESHEKRLYDIFAYCLLEIESSETSHENLEIVFKSQQQALPPIETSLFDLFLKESAFPIIRLYFSLVKSLTKSLKLFSTIINSKEVVDRDSFDFYLLTIPELEVNTLVKISPETDTQTYSPIIVPVLLGALYKAHNFLFDSLLLHPKIDLNGDFEFIYIKPQGISKWPALPLHLHALLLFEFHKFWKITSHPFYHRRMNFIHIFNVLFIIYHLILMNLKKK